MLEKGKPYVAFTPLTSSTCKVLGGHIQPRLPSETYLGATWFISVCYQHVTWQRCEALVCDHRSQSPIHWVSGFIPGKVLPGPSGLGPAALGLDLIICLGHAVSLGNT